MRVFPECEDYLQYVKNLFWNLSFYSFGDVSSADAGYHYGIFFNYLYLNYGDTVTKRMWELVAQSIEPYKALDSTLRVLGSSLNEQWKNFLPWIYYTGHRACEGRYFKNAGKFAEIKYEKIDTVKSPSLTFGGNLPVGYQLNALRMFLPADGQYTDDTLDIIVTNANLYGSVDFSFSCSDTYMDNSIRIGNTKYYLKSNSNEINLYYKYFHLAGYNTYSVNYAYPSPFKLGVDEILYFPVPVLCKADDFVDVKIFDNGMNQIFYEKLKVSVNNAKRVVTVNNLSDFITAGVYLFEIKFDEQSEFGKITIIR